MRKFSYVRNILVIAYDISKTTPTSGECIMCPTGNSKAIFTSSYSAISWHLSEISPADSKERMFLTESHTISLVKTNCLERSQWNGLSREGLLYSGPCDLRLPIQPPRYGLKLKVVLNKRDVHTENIYEWCHWYPVLKCRELLNRGVLNRRDHYTLLILVSPLDWSLLNGVSPMQSINNLRWPENTERRSVIHTTVRLST